MSNKGDNICVEDSQVSCFASKLNSPVGDSPTDFPHKFICCMCNLLRVYKQALPYLFLQGCMVSMHIIKKNRCQVGGVHRSRNTRSTSLVPLVHVCFFHDCVSRARMMICERQLESPCHFPENWIDSEENGARNDDSAETTEMYPKRKLAGFQYFSGLLPKKVSAREPTTDNKHWLYRFMVSRSASKGSRHCTIFGC